MRKHTIQIHAKHGKKTNYEEIHAIKLLTVVFVLDGLTSSNISSKTVAKLEHPLV